MILLFFSLDVVKEYVFELSGPIFTASIGEKEGKNVDHCMWASIRSLTQVAMSQARTDLK